MTKAEYKAIKEAAKARIAARKAKLTETAGDKVVSADDFKAFLDSLDASN